MIQFNLLPDVKLQYIKAQRLKRNVIMLSVVVSGAALALFIMFFTVVNVVQKQHLSNLDKDIAAHKQTLEAKPDLSKILTIQNQLNSLPALHSGKPVASRVYGYMQQITPQNASISTLTINFNDHTIKLEGSTDSLVTINTFVDTIKFTTFNASPADTKEGEEPTVTNGPSFNEVVLTDFAVSTIDAGTDPNKIAKYTITLKYDPAIFDDKQKVGLVVPTQVTTRSETEKPNEIFQEQTTGGNQ